MRYDIVPRPPSPGMRQSRGGSSPGGPNAGGPPGRTAPAPNFVVLWLIASSLWTVATVLRIQRVWVPRIGWSNVLCHPITWAELAIPPLTFALMLWALWRVVLGGRAPRD